MKRSRSACTSVLSTAELTCSSACSKQIHAGVLSGDIYRNIDGMNKYVEKISNDCPIEQSCNCEELDAGCFESVAFDKDLRVEKCCKQIDPSQLLDCSRIAQLLDTYMYAYVKLHISLYRIIVLKVNF